MAFSPDLYSMLLTAQDASLLRQLAGRHVPQLVWDINAVYFADALGPGRTLKLEARADRPSATDAAPFDEACYVRAIEDTTDPGFRNEGEAGMWYRVVARDTRIEQLEVVRCYIGTPGSHVVAPGAAFPRGTVTPVDCGILVTTAEGILPAVQLGFSFGFATWPEVRLYTRSEVEEVLNREYDVLPLDAAGASPSAARRDGSAT